MDKPTPPPNVEYTKVRVTNKELALNPIFIIISIVVSFIMTLLISLSLFSIEWTFTDIEYHRFINWLNESPKNWAKLFYVSCLFALLALINIYFKQEKK